MCVCLLNTSPLQETKEASLPGQPLWLRLCLCCYCQCWSLIIHRPEARLALSCVLQQCVSIGNIQPFCESVWQREKEWVAMIVCIFHGSIGGCASCFYYVHFIYVYYQRSMKEHMQGHEKQIPANPVPFRRVYMFVHCVCVFFFFFFFFQRLGHMVEGTWGWWGREVLGGYKMSWNGHYLAEITREIKWESTSCRWLISSIIALFVWFGLSWRDPVVHGWIEGEGIEREEGG